MEIEEEERSKKLNQPVTVSEFRINKIKKEIGRNWDLFYKRNEDRFFKNRYWTKEEFDFEGIFLQFSNETISIFEAGCGVGNCLLPLLNFVDKPVNWFACDISPRAVDILKKNKDFHKDKCVAFVGDLRDEEILLKFIRPQSIHLITLIFVLSALPKEEHLKILKNCLNLLKKDGGRLFIRDYAEFDETHYKFNPETNKLEDNFYRRQDDTCVYFFNETYLKYYVHQTTTNKKEEKNIPRLRDAVLDFTKIGKNSIHLSLEDVMDKMELTEAYKYQSFCYERYAKEPFSKPPNEKFTCIEIANNKFKIFETTLLGRMVKGDEISLDDRWKSLLNPDPSDVADFSNKSYMSEVVIQQPQFSNIKVEYYIENVVTLSLLFGYADLSNNNDWFKVSNLVSITGPLHSGGVPYILDNVIDEHIQFQSFYKYVHVDYRYHRHMAWGGGVCGCSCDPYLIGIIANTDYCKDVYMDDYTSSKYFIIYSNGPLLASKDDFIFADALTVSGVG
ncbi:hypothetical protein SNEBB_004051 [Seison nebaliae]|nr:hypothetical protein SNEBB_004051 [Seison nebaliae]